MPLLTISPSSSSTSSARQRLSQRDPLYQAGSLALNPRTRNVFVRGQRVQLSNKEYELLLALMRDPTRVFTRRELLRDVWGIKQPLPTRTLDSHIMRLRSKLHAVSSDERFIHTVWGVGFKLIDVR